MNYGYDDPQVHPSTYVRIAQLRSSALFPSLRRFHCYVEDSHISYIILFQSPLLDSISLSNIDGYENTVVGPFLATLSRTPQMLSRIVLDSGRMSVDILKKYFVHLKQLRTLKLSDAVSMSDFSLWEVLGMLPLLGNLTLEASNPVSHPAHAPENSNSRSGGLRYFDALEKLSIKGSSFLIQHLLGFIDSPRLNSIEISESSVIRHAQNEHVEPEDFFTLVITIIASKWSQSLKNLDITGNSMRCIHPISKVLSLKKDLHNLRTFCLWNLRMGNKLKTLRLPLGGNQFISLSTLEPSSQFGGSDRGESSPIYY